MPKKHLSKKERKDLETFVLEKKESILYCAKLH